MADREAREGDDDEDRDRDADREESEGSNGDDERSGESDSGESSGGGESSGDESDAGEKSSDRDESDEDDKSSDRDDSDDSETSGDDGESAAKDDREEERRQKDTPDEEETREPQETEDRESEDDEDEEDEEDQRPGVVKSVFLVLGTAIFLFVGFMLFAALIAPTYISALILTAVWFAIAFYLLMRLSGRKPHWAWLLRGTFATFVLVVLVWLLVSTLGGTTVNETLATGQKISDTKPTARIPEAPQKNPPQQNILLSAGKFGSAGAGSATGDAAFVKLPSGQVKLTIRRLDVTSGPTLHVFLAPGDGKDVTDHRDLGSLKGNKGDQQYNLPPGTDPHKYVTVVIWCKFLGVPFARASLSQQ